MPKMSTLLGRMNRISVSRRAASTILYFGMVGLGLSGVVVKLSTTGPVQLSNGLLICDIFWFILLLGFGCINTVVEDYDILEIGGYVLGIILTTSFAQWKYNIRVDQLFVYVPALVDLGIFLAAIGITIVHKTPEEQAELMEGLRTVMEFITNFSLARLCGGGSGDNGEV
ncbi:hypothetical protein F5882DRAFT_47829 [Hyaloscypha sp. PMI_1271]|nr:hypothetical protein F5882DRAFT_47829 [Hyaloscypha sp. PMI_1271]